MHTGLLVRELYTILCQDCSRERRSMMAPLELTWARIAWMGQVDCSVVSVVTSWFKSRTFYHTHSNGPRYT